MSFEMYSFGQFCRFLVCLVFFTFFLSVVQCFRILRGCSTVLITITSESSPKALQLKKKYLHKEFDVFSSISVYGVLGQFL